MHGKIQAKGDKKMMCQIHKNDQVIYKILDEKLFQRWQEENVHK